MTGLAGLRAVFSDPATRRPLRVLGASGQLGYGIPKESFEAGVSRRPDLIGCDMGSIDIGPFCLGSGEMGTSQTSTRRDLRRVLMAARQLDVPLVIGSAGSAGAGPHLDVTLDLVRDIAKEEGLHFRMASIRADIPGDWLKRAGLEGRVSGLDGMPKLTDAEVDAATHLVGQMGVGSFCKALETDAEVIIAGRACDPGIFAALPILLGFPPGLALHMAKIVECASICCLPGGRDPIMATLDDDGFELESMAPQRRATPTSVAAHSLYEQSDPYVVHEPEGTLDLQNARYHALDDRRVRVEGAVWNQSEKSTIKIEGARLIGFRAVMLAAAADPRFIDQSAKIFDEMHTLVASLICDDGKPDYTLAFRAYGMNQVLESPEPVPPKPREIFILGECVAPTPERAAEVVRTAKQYLLHFGYEGRTATGGNLAFPFTPPEVSVGPAYRFNVYHLVAVDDAVAMFPIEVETC